MSMSSSAPNSSGSPMPPKPRPSPTRERALCKSAAQPAGESPVNRRSAAEECNRRQLAGRLRAGTQGAQQQLRASSLTTALAKNRAADAATPPQFAARTRKTYYRRVESEVVQLALAIARKILHREAQLDPRALAGIVRVTLEKLRRGTTVHLHVQPAEKLPTGATTSPARWKAALAPEVHEDAACHPGNVASKLHWAPTEVGLAVATQRNRNRIAGPARRSARTPLPRPRRQLECPSKRR